MGERSRAAGVVRPEFGEAFDWVVVGLGVALAAIHLYLGVAEGRPPFVVIAAGFLVGVVLFPTRLWRPVVYLLWIAYVFVLGVIWALDGTRYPAFGAATGAASLAFVAVAAYRFVRETSRSTPD